MAWTFFPFIYFLKFVILLFDLNFKFEFMPALTHLFTFKIGGAAGQGIKSIGLTFSRICTRSGYNTFNYIEYPSLIRGGHNVMQTTVNKDEINSPTQHTTFLIALNQDTIDKHVHELVAGGGVLYDNEKGIEVKNLPEGVTDLGMPLAKLAKDAGGTEIMSNTVAMGALMALTSGSLDHFKNLISEEFADKGDKVIKPNHAAAQAGFDYVDNNFADKTTDHLKPLPNPEPKIVINANEAIARGAVAAGLQFACIYPMTPSTGVLHNLAPLQEKYNFVYKQPEDEISAINMAIGAANAGARSLVATSGGGFCLMAEGYGLAGLTETPVVIIEAMRGSPATGIPTWSEQGDLRLTLHAHQGDFPRIVLAAGDAKEAFELTMTAFNLADKYQTTVVLIEDKLLAENDQSFVPFDYSDYQIDRGKYTDKKQENFKRYELTDDGVSTRTCFGSGNFFIANSDEHDEIGYSKEESDNRNAQMEKRMKKLATCAMSDMPEPTLYGPENADITFISWGSNKGSIIDAIKHYDNVNYLHLTWVNPFPVEAVKRVLQKAKYVINVEQNISAQMGGLITEKTGIAIWDNFLKYDGRPIYPEELMEKIESVLGR
jgi:2-oxoglutarate/2-oxoacid ferredoxin oxidoreductase subunit alpha